MELSVVSGGFTDATAVHELINDATAKSRSLAATLADHYEKLSEDSFMVCSLELLPAGTRNCIRDVGIHLKRNAVEIRQHLERTNGKPRSPAHVVKDDAAA